METLKVTKEAIQGLDEQSKNELYRRLDNGELQIEIVEDSMEQPTQTTQIQPAVQKQPLPKTPAVATAQQKQTPVKPTQTTDIYGAISEPLETQEVQTPNQQGEMLKQDTKATTPTAVPKAQPIKTATVDEETKQKLISKYGEELGSSMAETLGLEEKTEEVNNYLKLKVSRLKKLMGAYRVFNDMTDERRVEMEDSIKDIFKVAGYDSVKRDSDGNLVAFKGDTPYEIDGNFFNKMAFDLAAQGFEIGGSIGGAMAGFMTGKTPIQKIVGGGAGAAIGAFTGSLLDDVQAAIELDKEFNLTEAAQKAEEAAWLDIAGTSAVAGIFKTAGITKAAATKIKEYAQGNLSGAKEILKSDYGLTDEQIEQSFKDMNLYREGKAPKGIERTKEKLLATVLQTPQAHRTLQSAVIADVKGAIEASKTIEARAIQLNEDLASQSLKPVEVKQAMKDYEDGVKSFYNEMSGTYSKAFEGVDYKVNPDIFQTEALKDIQSRITDKTVADKLEATINSFKVVRTMDDLFDARKTINRFYSKNKNKIDLAQDKKLLAETIQNIDREIEQTTRRTFTPDVSEPLLNYFKTATEKYHQMFKTQDTDSYKKITRKGLGEDEIAKRLIKAGKAADDDFETFIEKLPPEQRKATEYTLISELTKKYTKGDVKAVDFNKLLPELTKIEKHIKNPEAKQTLKNIETFAKKFPHERFLQSVASRVKEVEEKNIATTFTGKLMMKLSNLRFSIFQRMIPTETGKRLALQKAIGESLRTSRTPHSFLAKLANDKTLKLSEREEFGQSLKQLIKEEREIIDEVQAAERAQKLEKFKEQQKEQQDEFTNIIKEAKRILGTDVEFKSLKEAREFAREFKAQYIPKEKKLNERATQIKAAKEPSIGGSEDEAKEQVKSFFTKRENEAKKYGKMTDEELEMENKRLLSIEEGKKKYEIEKAKKDGFDVDEYGNVIPFASPTVGSSLLGGSIAGIEQDENGNITINPEKFLIGAVGGGAFYKSASSIAKNYKNNPYFRRKIDAAIKKVAKDSAIAAEQLGRKLRDKYPFLDISPKMFQPELDKTLKAKLTKEEWNKNLMEWHKESHPLTKNEDGTPKVFYHGTTNSFSNFDPKKIGETDSGWYGKGYYFSSVAEDVEDYAGGKWNPYNKFDDGGNIMPVYINLKNPKIIKEQIGQNTAPKYQNEQELIRQGYDGVIVRRYDEDGFYNDEYVVFDPTQIKSINNRGTFDSSNPNILKASPHLASGTVAGTANAIEYDDKGNIKGFDESKFITGFMAGAFGSKVAATALKRQNPKLYNKIAGISDKYPNMATANPKLLAEIYKTAPTAKNQALMFAGEKAMKADIGKLDEAKKLMDDGASEADVWKKTGWFKGDDGKWRFEIDDSGAKIKVDETKYSSLDAILEHPSLFEKYPELKDIDVQFLISHDVKQGQSTGLYHPYVDRSDEDLFPLSREIQIKANNIEEAKSTLLHEVQHAIQDIEDFARGGSVNEFRAENIKEIRQTLKDIEIAKLLQDPKNPIAYIEDLTGTKVSDDVIEMSKNWTVKELEDETKRLKAYDDPMQSYRSLHGEAEARLTQTRAKKGRTQFPYENLDVPRKELIKKW